MMATRSTLRSFLVLLAVTGVGCVTEGSRDGEPAPPAAVPASVARGSVVEAMAAPTAPAAPAAPSAPAEPWLSASGTTTLGFGLLRVAPAPGAAKAAFRVRFRDHGDGGYASDATSACVIPMGVEPFAASPAVHADAWLGFGLAKAEPGAGVVEASAEFTVEGERTVLVAYGPWDGADTGRPPSNVHTFTLFVQPLDGGRWRWIESEAGELVTTNWTRRPGVERGGSFTPAGGEPLWIESRILVLYDPRNARSAAAPPADALDAERLALPADLFSVLEKVPIRWR